MGQCASSGELPLANPAEDQEPCVPLGGRKAIARRLSESETSPQRSALRKHFKRRSSGSSWVITSRFIRGNRNNDLSATFNVIDYDLKVELLNINTATEEELMTLPGVTRQVARSIVDYRETIGGFKRVEDLALVTGVGAAKLEAFKSDITVKKKSSSYSSSCTQSIDSLPSCESGRSGAIRSVRGSPQRVVNINSASIFDLMAVRGMNQEMAANIVEYRERKGQFRTVDELLKVRGINTKVLSFLRLHLTVSEALPSSPASSEVTSIASTSRVLSRVGNGKLPGHRRTRSAPVDTECISSPKTSSDLNADIFELLSLRSERPVVEEIFDGDYSGTSAIRVASWNLQQLTREKSSNPGVMEVICRTILENGFSLLAVQEIGSKDILEKICSELNQNGNVRRVREWGGPRGEWRWQVSDDPAGKMFQGPEYAAFIYNTHHGLQLLSASLLSIQNCIRNYTRKPYLGYFKSNAFDFVVVNLHIKAEGLCYGKKVPSDIENDEEEEEGEEEISKTTSKRAKDEATCLSPLVSALKEKLASEKNVILLGDFSMGPEDSAFDVLRRSSYANVIPGTTFTNISSRNSEGTKCCDNIWLNFQTLKAYTGSWGVVRQGLSHLAIPKGWSWGGTVSDHCPVYCDIYTHQNYDTNTRNWQ